QPEPIRRHDVLVEAEVYDPRSGPRETPLLRVAELSWCRDRVRRLIEKRVARSAGLGIANLVRPPRAAEKPAQPVQRLPRIPRTGGIEPAEEWCQVLAAARLEERRGGPAAEERVGPARH